jgi:positive regulator of sigma E activity
MRAIILILIFLIIVIGYFYLNGENFLTPSGMVLSFLLGLLPGAVVIHHYRKKYRELKEWQRANDVVYGTGHRS